jgi:hypothetical protein
MTCIVILFRMFSISMNEMQRWLIQYDNFRTNPDQPNGSWTSYKYDIEGMHWSEIEKIYQS